MDATAAQSSRWRRLGRSAWRVGRWVVLVVLVLLGGGVAGCALMLRVPAPTTQQQRLAIFPTENLPIGAPVTIYWNEYAVPFVEAQSDEDLAFALGLVHAHLRLGQITMINRLTQGRLSESAGPFAVDIDQGIRMLDIGRVAPEMIAAMPPETRTFLERFRDGLNTYQSSLEELPIEFKAMGWEVEPFTLEDIVRMGRLICVDINWFSFARLIGQREHSSFPEFQRRLRTIVERSLPSFEPSTIQIPPTSGDASAPAIAQLITDLSRSGSNSFVIGPGRSATGAALIANDPHVGISQPNFWMLIGMKSPSYHVVGLSIPGVPVIGLGRNQHVAWGGTNMMSASSDLVALGPNEIDDLVEKSTEIDQRWLWKVTRTWRESPEFGPVFSDLEQANLPKDKPLALRWMGHLLSDEYTAFHKSSRARNVEEFRQAFDTYAVAGQNMLAADDQGNIQQIMAVRLPKRGRLLQGEEEIPLSLSVAPEVSRATWRESIKSTDLPYALNPKKGYLVSANNPPVHTTVPSGYFYYSNDRLLRLHESLDGDQPVTTDTLRSLQRDVTSPRCRILAGRFVEFMQAAPNPTPAMRQVAANLKDWNGELAADSKAALWFMLFTNAVGRPYYTDRYSLELSSFIMGSTWAQDFLIDDLAKPDDKLVAALRAAAETVADQIDSEGWTSWGDVHRLQLGYMLSRLPIIGSGFDVLDVPVGGSTTTLMKTATSFTDQRHGASYGAVARHISDMSDLDENYFALLGGQDGWVNSASSADQVPLWLGGEFMRLPLRLESVRRDFPFRLELAPLTPARGKALE